MKKRWLNFILHLSSLVHKEKTKSLTASPVKSIFLVVKIIILELFLLLLSLPFYFFVVPEKISVKSSYQIKLFRLRRRLTLVVIVIFIITAMIKFSFGFLVIFTYPEITEASPSFGMIRSGSYTGDSQKNRVIEGLGFQPDVVIIKGNNLEPAVMKTSSMNDGMAKFLSAWEGMSQNLVQTFTPEYIIVMAENGNLAVHRAHSMSKSYFLEGDEGKVNRIVSFDNDGFSVGDSSATNSEGVTYHYVAWNEIPGTMKTGNYLGDGDKERFFPGLGLNPEYAVIVPDNEEGASYSILSGLEKYSMLFSENVYYLNGIESMKDQSFQIGSDIKVNQKGKNYFWIVFSKNTNHL